MRREPADEVQRRYFEEADAQRFRWTVEGAGFAETEDELLSPLLGSIEGPCLEIGCGEGNNLVRLERVARCVGLDRFPKKLRFAAAALPGIRPVAGDAVALPFRPGSFATVFIRDLLHHLPDPEAALAEAIAVLRPGGLLCLLEPNGGNPLIGLQTRLVRAEAGARRFGTHLIKRWLRRQPLTQIDVRTCQPLPLRRLVLHYRFGWPALGRLALTRGLLRTAEGLLARLVPRSRWACVVATARRAAAGSSP